MTLDKLHNIDITQPSIHPNQVAPQAHQSITFPPQPFPPHTSSVSNPTSMQPSATPLAACPRCARTKHVYQDCFAGGMTIPQKRGKVQTASLCWCASPEYF